MFRTLKQSFKISSKPPLGGAAERGVDYYALLEVPRDASQEDITKAWRSLVLLHHPDKQAGKKALKSLKNGEVNVDIRLVNEAKWVLGDRQRRKEWEEAFFEGKLAINSWLLEMFLVSLKRALTDIR